MPNLSLPVISQNRGGATATQRVDRSKPYKSCPWLEGGLAFNRRSLHACLIVHHDRGYPFLCDFNGGEVDMATVLAARERIIAENQAGGHEDCAGCSHLVLRRWPQPRKPIRLIGIAQFARCNIECSYCYLQRDDPATFVAGFDPYAVLPALHGLARNQMLDRRLIVDWGGGEPTIYPEFDEAMEFITRLGATTWIHTNGTRVPRPLRDGLSARRIHVLCSVDAGTPETWQKIKNRDLLAIVWRNLEEYVRLGCRVVLKYIVTEENCSEEEIRAFVHAAARTGARDLILDIDYNHPSPSEAVCSGLRLLHRLGTESGFYTTFGSTGANFTPEIDVGGRLASRNPGALIRWKLRLMHRFTWARSRAALAMRLLPTR